LPISHSACILGTVVRLVILPLLLISSAACGHAPRCRIALPANVTDVYSLGFQEKVKTVVYGVPIDAETNVGDNRELKESFDQVPRADVRCSLVFQAHQCAYESRSEHAPQALAQIAPLLEICREHPQHDERASSTLLFPWDVCAGNATPRADSEACGFMIAGAAEIVAAAKSADEFLLNGDRWRYMRKSLAFDESKNEWTWTMATPSDAMREAKCRCVPARTDG
jgi:hypothetical protein